MSLENETNKLTNSQLIKNLQEVLTELQSRTIGLADVDGSMLPIIDHQKQSDIIGVVKVTSLFAVAVIYLQRDSANKAIIFEEGQTIKDYVKSPVAFNRIVERYNQGKKKELSDEHKTT